MSLRVRLILLWALSSLLVFFLLFITGFLIFRRCFGIIGCAVNLVTMIVVSLATEEPDEATQKMVDEVRIPKGETVLAASH